MPFSDGTLAISSAEPNAYSEHDVRALQELAEVLSIGFRRLEDMQSREAAERQLRQAQKREAVGQLAGGVAHDFNNLLTVIMGNCQMVLRQLRPGHPQRLRLEGIRQAGDRAASLVRQLLAFSRRQVLQPQILDLNELVTKVQGMLGRLLGDDIEVAADLAPALGQVHADSGQLEQVIMNLAVNARDAMPEGGRLTIHTANADLDQEYNSRRAVVTPGAYVLLAVSDTGTGMDEETQERLFEPFYTTKEAGKGTGLGLSTVYGIVKQSGGYVWVYSELGLGTTFKIYLPRVGGEAAAIAAREEAEVPRRGSETILVVEDDEMVRGLVVMSLEDLGYTVVQATCGDEALELAASHPGPIRLVLSDVVMPGMPAHELADRLREELPKAKLLWMSGHMDDELLQQRVQESAALILQKPFTPDELGVSVREVLDASWTRTRP